MTTEQATIQAPTTTERCHQLLVEAGLRPLWQPDKVSAYLVDLCQPVLELVEKPKKLNLRQAEAVIKLAESVGQNGLELFGTPRTDDGLNSFRAHAAIGRKKGNCIARLEAENGIYAALGLGKLVVGRWNGRHASSGLVIGDSIFDSLGSYRTGTSEGGIFSTREYEAWLQAARSQAAVSIALLGETHEQPEPKPLDRLNELTTTPGKTQPIVLPGSAASLMLIAMAARRGGPKYEQAAEKLKSYALKA